jgi:hypothetical protein
MANEKSRDSQAATGDYEVGYRKPPKHTRFKSGQSGNPRGRPKGTKNLKTDLMEELGEKVVIREGDQSRQVSKQRAVVKSLVTRTLKGDTRAGSLLMSMMMRLLDTGEGAPTVTEPLLDDEREILQAFEVRVQRGGDRRAAAAADGDDAKEEDAS